MKKSSKTIPDADRTRLFEENYETLHKLMKSKVGRWRLRYLKSMDFDDVTQIIETHVFNKMHLWDTTKNFGPWCNTVICNQMFNLIDKHHKNKARPCLSCPHALPDNACAKFDTQNSQCSLFKTWENGKAAAYYLDYGTNFDVQSEYQEISVGHEDGISPQDWLEKSKHKICEDLDKAETKIFECLYIKNLSSLETAKEMGYKTKNEKQSVGYKEVEKVNRKIVEKAKKIVREQGVYT